MTDDNQFENNNTDGERPLPNMGAVSDIEPFPVIEQAPDMIPIVDFKPESLTGRRVMEKHMRLVSDVTKVLLDYGLKYGTLVTKNDQMEFAGVKFYLTYDRINESVELGFNAHPSVWNVERIKTAVDNLDMEMAMDDLGFSEGDENPFRW